MKSFPRISLAIALATALSVPSWAASPEVPGIPNFYRVNDSIFRGAQPLDQAWPALAQLGVKTVIDLRQATEHSLSAEAQLVQAAGMRYVSFPTDGFANPDPDQIAKVLEVVSSAGPVFIHCKQGRDRTGTVVAAYRMAHDGWSNDRALAEALASGMHWYEAGMKRFIRGYRPAMLASAASSDSLQAPPALSTP